VERNKWKSIVTGPSPVIYGHILILSSCPDHHHHQQSPVNAGKLNIVRRVFQKVPLFPKLSPTDHAKPISAPIPSFLSVSQQKNALLLFAFWSDVSKLETYTNVSAKSWRLCYSWVVDSLELLTCVL
jgi:hypothetical protein